MAAFAFATAISLVATGLAATSAAANTGIVSLNLCTDELVLLVAEPARIRSLSYLSHAPEETPLWRKARLYKANDGSMLAAAAARPGLIVTMGPSGRDRERLAKAVGARLLTLPYPMTLNDVTANLRAVGRVTGGDARARRIVATMHAAAASTPSERQDAIWVDGAGRSFAADGLGAAWLGLAGLRQRAVAGQRLRLETLIVSPPAVLVQSRYRAGQTSSATAWRRHPVAHHARAGRTLETDGRRWTCMGPSLLPEILRLRRVMAR